MTATQLMYAYPAIAILVVILSSYSYRILDHPDLHIVRRILLLMATWTIGGAIAAGIYALARSLI